MRGPMGCDIHMHTEIKVDGVWHHYSHPKIAPLYRLFAKLANVRNEYGIAPIAPLRGLPEDVTFTTKVDAELWGDGKHHCSWITGEELSEVVRWFDALYEQENGRNFMLEHKYLGYLFGNDWASKPPIQGFEAVRAVFWFDS